MPRFRLLLAAALAATPISVSLIAVPPTAAWAAPGIPDDVALVAVRHSLLGKHSWYRQTYQGVPVLDGFYATHTIGRTGRTTTQDGRLEVAAPVGTAPKVGQDFALRATVALAGGAVTSSELVVVPGIRPVLAWRVLNDVGDDSTQTLVDAQSGTVIRVESVAREVDGSGRVFSPNPVVSLQNQSLGDSNNADSAAFAAAYQTVPLTHLGAGAGLVGDYAKNVSSGAVTSAGHVFSFNRSQPGFEQVMGYHAITSAQVYIQSLGFTEVNNSPQDYRTTGLSDDNSFFDPSTDRITFGTGGVDDAEDAEVIWHEYGHAVQAAQVPNFGGGSQAGAIGEGFGDYLAYTMSIPVSVNSGVTPLACIADWDAVSYTTGVPHCLRRVDGTKVYPGGATGEVHDDGEIWSRALFDIHAVLGRTTTDKIILEAQFSFAPNTSFAAAARTIVTTARSLYGAEAAAACTAALHARGFI